MSWIADPRAARRERHAGIALLCAEHIGRAYCGDNREKDGCNKGLHGILPAIASPIMRPVRPEIKRLRWPAASERPVCVLTTGDPSAIFGGMAVTKLDLTGLKCPLPALKTRKALTKLNPGDRLEVHCTDPLAIIDIPNLINQTGDRVEVTQHAERRIVFMIEKVSGAVA